MNIASSYWEKAYFDKSFNRAEWQAHPLTLKRLWELQGGSSREDWFFRTYLKSKPIRKAVSIGAGRAETEIEMLRKGYVEHFVLIDITKAGIEHAKHRAGELGFGDRVTCRVVEPGTPSLERDEYDLAMFVASLHHMSDVPASIKSVLKGVIPGGHLWCANEYIGPNRFNYPKDHVRITKAYYDLLPTDLCKHGRKELVLPTPDEVAEADPSEAPHSEEILKVFANIAPLYELTPLYGSFAFIIFWGLNHDALYETDEGKRLVEEVLRIDRSLVDGGVLPNYFCHLVAKKYTPRQNVAHRIGIASDGALYKGLSSWRKRIGV
ncbi:class I SAM-dependent methyltransferase [Brucella anthropi]|uniref:class I SAM-dependent methyltransferase n=1 Tax=Brucella anthropi TaxID=529 RepID=UPI00125E3F0C|nr:class I SAM-dependent methyltransferase [Brucella anthropi]QFP61879.1 class I SAM-dependent methyltransferase [Brucella anthropi]